MQLTFRFFPLINIYLSVLFICCFLFSLEKSFCSFNYQRPSAGSHTISEKELRAELEKTTEIFGKGSKEAEFIRDIKLGRLEEGEKQTFRENELQHHKAMAGVWQDFIINKLFTFSNIPLITLGTAAVYGTVSTIRLAAHKIESAGKNPIFVNDTNHVTFWDEMNALFSGKEIAYTKASSALFFNEGLQQRLDDSLDAFKNLTNYENSTLSHRLFYGPPGTGKTEIAKRMATETGCKFYILNGATYATHGKEGVDHWNNLMENIRGSSDRFVIFIDEAEQLLYKRTEGNRGAFISSFLQLTGGSNEQKFCFILATNYPEKIDEAVLSRCSGEWIYFDLPDKTTRAKMIKHFVIEYFVRKPAELDQIKPNYSVFSDEYIKQIAEEKTEGYSGRDLVKIVEKIHTMTLQKTPLGKIPEVKKETIETVFENFSNERRMMKERLAGKATWDFKSIIGEQASDDKNSSSIKTAEA